MSSKYYKDTQIPPQIGDTVQALKDFGGDIKKGDILEVSKIVCTISDSGILCFTGKESTCGTLSSLKLICGKDDKDLDSYKINLLSITTKELNDFIELIQKAGYYSATKLDSNAIINSKWLVKQGNNWYFNSVTSTSELPIETATVLLKERINRIKRLKSTKRAGYEYNYDYKIPILFESDKKLEEAFNMGVISKHKFSKNSSFIVYNKDIIVSCPNTKSVPRHQIWAGVKQKLIKQVNALYSYEVPVVLESKEEEEFLVTMGAKLVLTHHRYPIIVNKAGSTREKGSFSGNSVTFKEFLKDMEENIMSAESSNNNTGTQIENSKEAVNLQNVIVKVTSPEEHDFVVNKLNLNPALYAYDNNTSDVHYGNNNDFLIGVNLGSTIFTSTIYSPISTRIMSFDEFKNSIEENNMKDSPVTPDGPIVWKNPKPNNKNQREIIVGGKVVVDGLPLLQIVEKTTPKFVYLKGYKQRIKKEDVYPVFRQYTNIERVGNIYIPDLNDTPHIVTPETSVRDIKESYALKPEVIEYIEYSDGTIIHDDNKFENITVFQNLFKDVKLKGIKIEVSHTFYAIAKHYNLDVDSIKAKDVILKKELEIALDHPLNIAAKEWALIYGPSGTGKTTLGIEYALDKGKEYVKQPGNAQLTVDDFLGYKSITTGEYFRSLLREAVEFGKVFILDEMDACNPNTLLVLNGLKQDKFQFPDKLIPIHPEFRLIATANTLEYNESYNARSPLDKATLARFKTIEYNLANHELAIRYGLDYIKQIDESKLERMTARDVAREVIYMQINEKEV